ncbi:MAG: hypothetical protein NUV86_09550 [Candidatus Scalindua sp.]|nr:hypothetical protein [Candidatus Scalindua sp.]
MKSDKPVKLLADLMGKKTFFFPDELSNERVGNDNLRAIMVRVNGKTFNILTGQSVELSQQEFSTLKDSGMVTDKYTYSDTPEFDPLHENKIT